MSPLISPAVSPSRSTSTAPTWRALRALARRDGRELWSSRAALLFFVMMGPLVGHAFITAVRAYAEVSGAAGGPAALAQGLSPLDGIVVPTFGAYALAAALLFPFVVIRLVATEKESGAWRLALQAPVGVGVQLAVKGCVLLAAWVVSWLPGCLALALWSSYGGHLAAPEVATVLAGHLWRGLLVIGVGALAAAVTDGAASAAVVALACTLGGWALDFAAQVNGGVLQAVARFTPDAALRPFERGELRGDVTAVAVIVACGLLALAAAWWHPGRAMPRRLARGGAVLLVTTLAAVAGARWPGSIDTSEDRRNSFARGDERALSTIGAPLHVTVHLAPEDPRLADLERGVLRKLQRSMRHVVVDYAATTSTGLFERPRGTYGEIWYELGGKRAMQRSSIERVVLETIYALAGVRAPPVEEVAAYTGYPLRAAPLGAAWLFYLVWPTLVIALWWWRRTR